MIPFVFFSALILAIAFYATRQQSEKSPSWLKFFSKGKEAGFNIKDMEHLRKIAATCHMKDPAIIFTSQKQFEVVVRKTVNSARMSGEINEPSMQEFLSKLFDYCKKIELQNMDNKAKISNSRQIQEGQTLRVLVPGVGVFKSEVVKNYGNYMTITRPTNQKVATSMQWHGLKISIYFWREDDAGYVFDTEVVDEVFSKGISSIKIEHNDSLFRTQKRKSPRVKFRKQAFCYIINDNQNPHMLERNPGLRVMLDDISDSGCSFMVNGQASVGLRLKIQFSLDRVPICMPCTVRSVDFNQESNVSMVHLEADPLPMWTRNHILCEVFDLLPEEDEEELPFRVIEDEADGKVKDEGI